MIVVVELEWLAAGEAQLDRGGRLDFPRLPATAGIYRFRLIGEATTVYIGEAENLRKRAAGYRGGYAGQKTNARMNVRMREHLTAGGRIEIAIATAGRLTVDGEDRTLDLRRKATRLLAEAAALHAVPDSEPLENLPGIGDRSES